MSAKPSPSVPITSAKRGSAFSAGSSSEIDRSVSAMAAVRKPNACNSPMGSADQAQGTRNTLPIDTRTARRLSGSQAVRDSTTASMPKAAAERKIAPMLVASVTPSITHTRAASRTTSATDVSGRRRMAQSTPRVRV